ncbi:Hsp20/alpha crystallin family protein [Deminuibacter soli]|uniref:Hsp20/alpha crystallin family protein n=1 Tax=Deminuibacter soli TaxID=2291815 RepID=A0A3E1NJJ1_9BACT|nr:Hsp20/alpha crystallin family protein [Deminuibacter soli]RFM28107.1 Hsp20/alpha crystallin family protein [Deminuibacter soli]
MTLVKHNYRNFGNLFDEIFNGAFPANWNKDQQYYAIPPVNISETTEAYQLQLLAPGLNKEDFKVNVEKGLLTISYDKKSEQVKEGEKTHRREFGFNSFKRSFNVDDQVNVEGIEARYENGVLYLTLPKKEEVKVSPKAITIQ